ncbi:MAG: hypothetical protein ACTHKL_00060, partial [Streptosporangiaceae bacterium]
EAAAVVPDEWLEAEPGMARPDLVRDAHVKQLTARLASREAWLEPMRQIASQPGLPHREAPVRARPFWLNPSPRRRMGGAEQPIPPDAGPGRGSVGMTPDEPPQRGEVGR